MKIPEIDWCVVSKWSDRLVVASLVVWGMFLALAVVLWVLAVVGVIS